MQRRLSLAATLVPNPDLVFLDEPTAGIDPVLRQKFWERFKDLQNNGRTLFITTQYVGEAAFCDYVGVMANGRLLMVETPENLRKRAFGGQVIDLQGSNPISYEKVFAIQNLEFVRGKVHLLGENALRITVDDASRAIPELIEWCNTNGVPVESINEFVPPFDDVFVQIIQQEAEHA
jgi:ABC-2 type transport system ATP-binding protein